MTRVCLAGVTGWVGKPLSAAILENDDLKLVAAAARSALATSRLAARLRRRSASRPTSSSITRAPPQ